MSSQFRNYGVGLGPYRPIERAQMVLNLRDGGFDSSVPAIMLEEGQSPATTNLRLHDGGVSTDRAHAALGVYAGTGLADVRGIVPFQLENGTRFIMRMRPTRWERWNGTNWLQLSGLLTGALGDRYYTASMGNRFIGANGVDKLKSWDGVDANAVADLSADSPIASYITRIGNRILAARIKIGGVLFPNNVNWSADGVVTDYTTANLGAGAATLIPEGSGKAANFITGLSTLSAGAVIYRQRSIQLATLTGVGAAPFRFSTIDFTHGTESPYSIVNGGPKVGDFFLGHDYVPYHFDGSSEPAPIGLAIVKELRNTIFDLGAVVSVVDSVTGDLWICIPTSSDLLLRTAWVFSIREWVKRGKLVWSKRTLENGISAIGFGGVPTVLDPVMNLVTNIINTVNVTFDSYSQARTRESVLFGYANGSITYLVDDLFTTDGTWESKQFGDDSHEMTIDSIRLTYECLADISSVEVSVSVNGGTSYSTPKIMPLVRTGTGTATVADTFRVTGRLFQIKLRFLNASNAYTKVTKIQCFLNDRGNRVA